MSSLVFPDYDLAEQAARDRMIATGIDSFVLYSRPSVMWFVADKDLSNGNPGVDFVKQLAPDGCEFDKPVTYKALEAVNVVTSQGGSIEWEEVAVDIGLHAARKLIVEFKGVFPSQTYRFEPMTPWDGKAYTANPSCEARDGHHHGTFCETCLGWG